MRQVSALPGIRRVTPLRRAGRAALDVLNVL